MTAVMDRKATFIEAMKPGEARAITDQIKEHTTTVWNLLIEAHERKAWSALGYSTWSEYVQGEFNMSRSRSYQIIDQAQTIHAIESVVSTSVDITEAAVRDIKRNLPEVVADIEHRVHGVEGEEERREIVADVISMHRAAPIKAEGFTVDPSTGEVLDGPTITAEPIIEERTFTEKVKVSTPHEPKPIPRGDEANRLNAIQASKAIGSALETLLGLGYEGTRTRTLTDWWPIGKNEVPPAQSELFTPSRLRQIAQGIIQTANEMEAQRV